MTIWLISGHRCRLTCWMTTGITSRCASALRQTRRRITHSRFGRETGECAGDVGVVSRSTGMPKIQFGQMSQGTEAERDYS